MPEQVLNPEKQTAEKPFPWRCPKCRQPTVTRVTMPYRCQRKHDGRVVTVEIPNFAVPRCSNCDELVFDYAADEQIRAAFAAGTKDIPTLTSDEMAASAYAEQVLPLGAAALGDEYYYQSLSLCIIDAVYSIGVRYEGVQRVVARYCKHFGLPRFRKNRAELPAREEQEPLSAFCTRLEDLRPERLATEVFGNRQRTSARNGILKAEAVQRFAQVLRAHGIEHLQDTPGTANNDALENAIRRIPGQTSGISLRYFFMLAGTDDFIKPDRMVTRFLQTALGRSVSSTEAQSLLRAVSKGLRGKYPHLTPRLLDYEVWKYQRGQ